MSQLKLCSDIINSIPTNFEQYRATSLLFVEGVATSSSTHVDILDEESNIIVSVLSKLNRLDCITIDSQPHVTETYEGLLSRSRPYVYFYFPRRKITQLTELFLYDNEHTIMTIYDPLNKTTNVFNKQIYTELATDDGFFPLHQDYLDGEWKESYETSFHPGNMEQSFDLLNYTNEAMLEYGRNNMVLVNIIGNNFTNEMFHKMAYSAHALFFS